MKKTKTRRIGGRKAEGKRSSGLKNFAVTNEARLCLALGKVALLLCRSDLSVHFRLLA